MSDFATRRMMMVDNQIRPSDVTKFPIIDAMMNVPREFFVPTSLREAAYVGEHLDLGNGRVILDPRTLAKMLDAVDVQPGDMVLDIGTAHGYSAALLSRLAQTVVAVEEDGTMASEAASNLSEAGADNVAVIEGSLTDGAGRHGPYDVIVVQGAVQRVPEALLAQLGEGGRIVALFQEGALGVCRVGHCVDGAVSWRFAFNATAPVLPGFARAPAFQL